MEGFLKFKRKLEAFSMFPTIVIEKTEEDEKNDKSNRRT